MELGYNKNLRLCLWTQYNPSMGRKLGKGRKKIREDIRKWGHLQLSVTGKKILINQVMLSKIWYLEYVKKPLADIIQNIRKDIHDFLWNNRKVRVNRNTITLPIEMGGLAIMDIETQCEVTQCSILAKFIKKKIQNKTQTDLSCGIWINTEKRNKMLVSLRHT